MSNRQPIILLVLFVLLGASSYWLVWPAWTQSSQLRADLATWKIKVSETEQTENRILDLAKKYDNSGNLEKLLLALPEDEDQSGLIVQMENLSSTNGLVLNSINFSKTAGKSSANKTAATGETGSSSDQLAAKAKSSTLETMSLSFELSGSVDSLNNFLKALESNLRIMDIQSISFKLGNRNEVTGEEETSFLISLNTYYKSN